MTASRPPRIAARLLEAFGSSDQDALVGDLYEEFARRQSRSWFWRQALAAIVTGAWSEIRREPRRALSGVIVGWLVLGALAPISITLFNDGPITLSKFVWNPLDASLLWLLARFCAPAFLSGALLSRVSRSTGTLLMFATTIIGMTIVSFPLNAYTLSDVSAKEWALYTSTLPTACLLGFVLLPLSVLVGAANGSFQAGRAGRAGRHLF